MIFLAALLFLHLNDRYFHIGVIPSTKDIVRFFGGGAKPYVKPNDGEVTVSFIDVGQGDCELISTGEYNILIDCGDDDTIDRVTGFLKYSGVEYLNMVIVTHPHDDHYGGMYKLLKKINVGEVIMPELDVEGNAYARFLRVIEEEKIPLRYAAAGESFELGEDSLLEIIAPIYLDYDDENDSSIVARFTHGETTFLFTGDLGRAGELDLLDSGAALRVDVLKAGHHGSAGSSSAEFLQQVSPKIAVFESGKINYYGHPRSEVLDRLESAGCEEAYSTASNGNIVIVSDGRELRVVVERGEAYSFVE